MVDELLAYYAAHARDLPWRKNPTPYRVRISEIMLQQTRVEAVREYYRRFLEEFPNVEALAGAPEEKLFKMWEGLGYYSRARNLQLAARKIVALGNFPDSLERIAELPGIGPYTAGAIASIAFGLPEPAVDGNVLRVFARVKGKNSSRDEVAGELRPLYPAGKCSEFTQSLMELGATVCLPNGAPRCEICPLAGECVAKRENRIAELPEKPVKKPRRSEDKTVLFLECGDRVAIVKRPAGGLLAGLWEFPNRPGFPESGEALFKTLESEGFSIHTIRPLKNTKHLFSHLEWHMQNFHVIVYGPPVGSPYRWVTREELTRDFALPSAFAGMLRYAEESVPISRPEQFTSSGH